MRKRAYILPIVISIMSIVTIYSWGDGYKEARKKLNSDNRPWFVNEQIQSSYNSTPAQLPQAVTFPAVNKLMDRYQEQKDSTLKTVIQTVEPALLTERGQSIQDQAANSSLDSLLSNQVNMDVVLNIAYRRNPSIKAASQAWQAALERYPQAAYLEGILRQYNSFTKTQNLLLSSMQPQKQMVDTEWPFPGITSLRGDIIQEDIEIAKQDFAIALRDTLASVKKTYHDYAYIRQAIDITLENKDLLTQMLDVASQKFEAGNTSYNDVIKARVALSKLTDNLITLEKQRETIVAQLNTLLDRAPHAPMGTVTATPVSSVQWELDKLYEIAEQERQEIAQMQSKVQRTSLMIEMAQEMNRPDPTLGASYFQNESGLLVGAVAKRDSFTPAPRQRVRPWFGQRESFIAEMQERRQSLRQKLENTINHTLFNVKDAHFSLDTAYREAELFRTTLIPEARQSLDVAETDYLGARIDFLDYLDAQRTWLDFNLSHHKARRNYGKTLAELERVLGTSLNNIQ